MQDESEDYYVSRSKAKRRSDCPIANALEVLGDRWTLRTEAGNERSAEIVYTIEK